MSPIAFSANPQSAEIAARAEQELIGEISRIYIKANVQYQMKHYAEAARLFGDCQALYLASVDYFSDPGSLRPMAESCERLGWTRFLDQQKRKISYGMRV